MQAKDYNLIEKVYGNFSSFQERLSPILAAFNSPKSEIEVLEIGCGTGITTNIILSSRIDLKLTSVDNDSEMLHFAKQIIISKNVKFVQSDSLSFLQSRKDQEFDIVVSAFTVHNMANEYRTELYKNIFRVLSKSGLFLNADKFVSDKLTEQIEGLKYRIGTYIDVLVRENRLDLLKEWITHYVDDQQLNKILKFTETQQILKNIGFAKVDYTFKSELEMLGLLTAFK